MRALLVETARHVTEGGALVDVRSPEEFSGAVLSPPGLPESCQRGGHIPGAINIPWSLAINESDSTFLGVESLRALYGRLPQDGRVIAYCRIGERSSHTWFVLRYLLGYQDVGTTMDHGPNGGTWWGRRSVGRSDRLTRLTERVRRGLRRLVARVVEDERVRLGSDRRFVLALGNDQERVCLHHAGEDP